MYTLCVCVCVMWYWSRAKDQRPKNQIKSHVLDHVASPACRLMLTWSWFDGLPRRLWAPQLNFCLYMWEKKIIIAYEKLLSSGDSLQISYVSYGNKNITIWSIKTQAHALAINFMLLYISAITDWDEAIMCSYNY